MGRSDVSIVIPCLNEAKTIAPLVRSAAHFGDVVVVDDGSTDDTGQRAREAGATVIRHDRPKGIGPSIMDGWTATGDTPRVVVMDAGGSHDVADLGRLLATKADIVIGSRFVQMGRYVGGSWWRRLGSRMAAAACNLVQPGPRIRDWTSGYRVYSRRAVRVLGSYSYTAKMHAWQMEVLGRARETGLSIQERPITYRAGRSSFKLFSVYEAVLAWLLIMHNFGGVRP